ncbi:MAG: oxidoreductase [Roseivirga sp.]|nr:oxidoreductase [Roseivirga sp.]
MERIKLSEQVDISRIVHGMWRLTEWNFSNEQIVRFVEECLEMGIDTFDHADIYGGYTCETLFGNALSTHPSLNNKLKVVTKCGIKLVTPNRPEHYIQHYDTSFDHIIWSAENSLKQLQRDNIDVLLIHRPDPFMNPAVVARAFTKLREEGKVKEFGVSNFLPSQFNTLQSYLDFSLVTNQVEVSVAALQEFENGVIDQCLEKRFSPMAWSPLAGGSVFTAETHRFLTIKNVLYRIAKRLDVSIDQVMYAWLLNHPAKMVPLVGSGKIDRVRKAVDSLDIELSTQQWFEIWVASQGKNVP